MESEGSSDEKSDPTAVEILFKTTGLIVPQETQDAAFNLAEITQGHKSQVTSQIASREGRFTPAQDTK